MSDPAVKAMTPTQWVFEYNGLIAAEEREVVKMQAQLRALKVLLVQLLGLRFTPPNPDKLDEMTFTPLSVLTGHPEVVKKMWQEADAEAAIDEGLNDETYEQFVDDLYKEVVEGKPALDPDMAPLILDNGDQRTAMDVWRSEEAAEALAALGVTLVDSEDELPDV